MHDQATQYDELVLAGPSYRLDNRKMTAGLTVGLVICNGAGGSNSCCLSNNLAFSAFAIALALLLLGQI